jgi:hypothetical protein
VVNVGPAQFSSSSNDPVRIGLFRFSKSLLLQDSYLSSNLDKPTKRQPKITMICSICLNRITKKDQQQHRGTVINRNKQTSSNDYDDDDDVVYTKLNSVKFSLNENSSCLYCGSTVNLVDYVSSAVEVGIDEDDDNAIEATDSSRSPVLDLVLFNYSKEIYTYEFNKAKSKSVSIIGNFVNSSF